MAIREDPGPIALISRRRTQAFRASSRPLRRFGIFERGPGLVVVKGACESRSADRPSLGGIVRVTWEDSQDTSTVWARAIAAATVKPNAIPWVLLKVVGARVGPTGGDTLFTTTFLQRVNTEGGLAPETGCDRLTDVGHKAFIPYTADYFFYRAN